MIPISLTLQGIYSYQEKQTIDFTRLTEANIFGIFGSVGSGKSTVLEAMTFALYGKTDRLNLSGDNRNYNMMNLKSRELFIEFIFKTGRSDTEFKATVKGRRNSRNFEDVKTLDRAAYKQVGNEWQPIEVDSLEFIIGLSYENFKRTVIIPQNRFQEFLQLGNSDRTRMMKELFDLNKYELFFKTVSLETKNNQQLQLIEFQLLQLGEINPEQIKEKEAALDLIKNEIKEKTDQLSLQRAQEERLRKLRELIGKMTEAEQTLSGLKAREPDYIHMEKAIGAYEYCLLNFKSLFESAKEIDGKIILYNGNISRDNDLLMDTTQQLSTLEKDFETLKAAFNGRETLKQQALELDKIMEIQEIEGACNNLNERILNGEKVYDETLIRIKGLTESQESATRVVKEIKDKLPDMVLLSDVKNWFTYHKSLLLGQTEIAHELISIQEDLLDIEKQKLGLLENDCFKGLPTSSKFGEMDLVLNKSRNDLKLSVIGLSNQVEHLSVQSKLEEYATNLKDGEPCPLCGALSHPQPLNARNVMQALERVRKQKADAENSITALDRVQNQLSGVTTTYLLRKGLHEMALQKQKDQESKILAHQEQFHWDAYRNEDFVSEAFTLAERLQLQLKIKEEEKEKFSQDLANENQKKDKFHDALEGFKHQLTANTSKISTLSGQILILPVKDYEGKAVLEIKRLKDSHLQKYHEIEIAYNTANNKINALRGDRSTISGRLEANKKTLDQVTASKEATDKKIQEQLDRSAYTTLTEIERILAQPMDIEQEKNKIKDFRESMNLLEKQLLDLKTEIGEQKYDEVSYQQIQSSISQISNEINLRNQQHGILGNELQKLKADLESQKGLIELATKLRARAEDIKTLKQLFKGSGFVNYISSVYLQELCHAANVRFYKLTRQRMSLEVTEDNNFQVRDFMNGGKARSVKTLSGGQTFQAALSLALALADNIQRITESKQNFFFLDEGFGSLDKESLDIVFDTLKSLRKENRIVGVISHVEEMQQEIDTHLKIVNDEEKGSLIGCSWN